MFLRRKLAYRQVFGDPASEPTIAQAAVMADLQKYCNVNKSTAMVSMSNHSVDPISMAMLEGRRQVYMRIQQYVNMRDEYIVKQAEISNE